MRAEAAILTVTTALFAVLLVRERRRAILLAAQRKRIEQNLASTQRALTVMNRAQKELRVCQLPELPPSFVSSSGWERCMAALQAVEQGYARFESKRSGPVKTTLISNFVSERPQAQKAEVDALLARHMLRLFPNLIALLSGTPTLVLLILDAPTLGTVDRLVGAIPQLQAYGSRICIPQADPAHYVQQVRGFSDEPQDGRAASEDSTACASLLLHVRNQRLDEWLSSNRRCVGLRVPLAFFDYETSVYGKPKVRFQPLRDLQLFFRLGYAATPTCLLGITLSFRAPHESRYVSAATLTPSDLEAFVASEASACGMHCTLIERVTYSLTFFLFELVAYGYAPAPPASAGEGAILNKELPA